MEGGALAVVCLACRFKGGKDLDDAEDILTIEDEVERVVESESVSEPSLEEGGSLEEGPSPHGLRKSSTSIIVLE